MSQIKGFMFFDSYYEQYLLLDEDERSEFLKAILEFAFNGIEPEFKSRTCKIAFVGIRPHLNKSVQNSKNGARGGAPIGNQNARKKTSPQEEEKNKNEEENKKVEIQTRNNRNSSEKQPNDNLILSLLNHLNSRTTGRYVADERNVNLITTLINRGFTEKQLKQVVDFKCDEWLNVPKMREQLKPGVLFKPENFERYLQECEQAPPTENEQRRIAKESKESEIKTRIEYLEKVKAEAEHAYNSETDRDKKQEARNRFKEVEAELESLYKRIGGAKNE